jgi:SAM-dependent methyltransferase
MNLEGASMVQEASKSLIRRSFDRRYLTRWFVGDGIDIGAGDDSLGKFASFFPLVGSVRAWDLQDGDAMQMNGVPDESYDFVHSSHCLEHLVDPFTAMRNWIRICRRGGHLVIAIPDEDLYEQGVFPSTFNADHKWTFTIVKSQSWSPRSINVIDLLKDFSHEVEIIKVELLDSGFIYGLPRQDQTTGTISESAIEIVLRKRHQPDHPGKTKTIPSGVVEELKGTQPLRNTAPQLDNLGTGVSKGVPPNDNILLRRKGAMGDVIMTTPVAARLRHLLGPDAIINIETGQLGVYIDNPHVNGVNVPEPAGGYQRVIDLDLAYERRPRMHAIDAFMLEAFADARWPAKQAYIHKASIAELPSLPWHRAVALHAAVTSRNRTFPRFFWEAVLDGIKSAGLIPVTLGARGDYSWPEMEGIVDLTHKLSIQQVASVIDSCSCFISGDTGLLQVAGSTATPIVGLYTSVRPEYRMPWREGILGWQVTPLAPVLDCMGCVADEPPPITSCECRRSDYVCVGTSSIYPRQVIDATKAYVAAN